METEKISSKSLEKVIYKCGQCRWLNGETSSVGIECTHPEKVWRRRTSKYHYKHTPACKKFAMVDVNCEIPLKLPSLNEYVSECRKNKYAGAKMKNEVEDAIGWYISQMPRFDRPVEIHFHWIEGNKKRDLDNICFAKKFILDAMVKAGKLKDDNRKCVTAFTDTFAYDKETKVILKVREAKNGDI